MPFTPNGDGLNEDVYGLPIIHLQNCPRFGNGSMKFSSSTVGRGKWFTYNSLESNEMMCISVGWKRQNGNELPARNLLSILEQRFLMSWTLLTVTNLSKGTIQILRWMKNSIISLMGSMLKTSCNASIDFNHQSEIRNNCFFSGAHCRMSIAVSTGSIQVNENYLTLLCYFNEGRNLLIRVTAWHWNTRALSGPLAHFSYPPYKSPWRFSETLLRWIAPIRYSCLERKNTCRLPYTGRACSIPFLPKTIRLKSLNKSSNKSAFPK